MRDFFKLLFIAACICGGLIYLQDTWLAVPAGFIVVVGGMSAAAALFEFEMPLKMVLNFIGKFKKGIRR